MYQTFEDLKVFQKAYKLSLEIHAISLSFPKIEQFAIADQMRRSSKSICANIVEGYGRRSKSSQEFKRFLTIALGSSDEMRLWSQYCLDLGYVNADLVSSWKYSYQEISKMLQGLIQKL